MKLGDKVNRTKMTVSNLVQRPLVTYILIGINLVVFMGTVFAGGNTDIRVLYMFGAKFTPALLQGEWWRLIAAMFLHDGIGHLFINMITLYFIGPEIEDYYGHARMLVIYLLSGLYGNLLSAFWAPTTLAVGASGALFGLFGAYLILGHQSTDAQIQAQARQFLLFVILNVVLGFSGNTDLAGHVGGLIAGCLITISLDTTFATRKQLLAGLLTVGSACWLIFNL